MPHLVILYVNDNYNFHIFIRNHFVCGWFYATLFPSRNGIKNWFNKQGAGNKNYMILGTPHINNKHIGVNLKSHDIANMQYKWKLYNENN